MDSFSYDFDKKGSSRISGGFILFCLFSSTVDILGNETRHKKIKRKEKNTANQKS